MIYTIIYSSQSGNGSYTFVSSHDKNDAWNDYINNHAEEGQEPLAICPGNIVVFFEDCISPEKSGNEAS